MDEKERKELEILMKSLEQKNEEKIVVWRTEIGDNQIRILPNKEGEKFFYIFYRHWVKQSGKNIPILCSQDDKCLLCKTLNPNVSNPQKRVLINLKDRKDGKCYVGEIPIKVFTQILAIVVNPQYLELLDPIKGSDINIKRQGQGIDTQYFVLPYRDASIIGEHTIKSLPTYLKKHTEEEIKELLSKFQTADGLVNPKTPPRDLKKIVSDLPF